METWKIIFVFFILLLAKSEDYYYFWDVIVFTFHTAVQHVQQYN